MNDLINFALIVLIVLSFVKLWDDRKTMKRLKAIIDSIEAVSDKGGV